MEVNRCDNISFRAKANVLGDIPEALRTSLGRQLATEGNDCFTHEVELNSGKDIAYIRSMYANNDAKETLGGTAQILRWPGESDEAFAADLLKAAKDKVKRFLMRS